MIRSHVGRSIRPVGSLAAVLIASRKHTLLMPIALSIIVGLNLCRISCASINYGNYMGDHVTFLDVTEDSLTDSVPLFNTPFVGGDSLLFNPIGFAALSNHAVPPVDYTDGRLTFMVEAKPGSAIQQFSLTESGITTLVGPGTDATFADVSATGILEVSQVDGVGILPFQIAIDLVFSHRPNGTWQLITDGAVAALPWSGSQLIDLTQELIDRGITYATGVTKISVDVLNSLEAQSEINSIALLDKKRFLIVDLVTGSVPEPTSCLVWGLLAATVGMITHRIHYARTGDHRASPRSRPPSP